MAAAFAAVLGSVLVMACESEPCVGDACPSTCFDQSCDESFFLSTGGTAGDGTTGGIGGTTSGGTGATTSGGTGGSGVTTGGSGGRGGTTGGGAPSGGRFSPCEVDAECDQAHGFGCVLGTCRYPCRSHFDCAGTGPCSTLPGEARLLGGFCEPPPDPLPPGRYYTSCPNADECAEDEGFLCLGSGIGDLDAYCSGPCASDADCPGGFLCDDVRTGPNTIETYCVRKGFCSSCETDSDCLAIANQVCARDKSGAKICTKLCDTGVDSCPWGNAAECAIWDSELGVPTCSHRFGSCRGEGKGCEPCVTDADCPLGFCNASSFTEERWCVDLTVDCSCDGLTRRQGVCTGENGCPDGPGGIGMLCYDDPNDQTSTAARSCFAGESSASVLGSPQVGCWR